MANKNNLIINENGIEKKAILYDKDFAPAKLIHNGNVLTNVSFNDKLIEGTTSVSYESEYKNNLISLEIEGNTEQILLPLEYQQVEYIESTGTEWIDTGFIADQDTRVVVEFELTEIYPSFVFGSRANATLNSFALNIGGNPSNILTSYGSSGNAGIKIPIVEKRYKADKDKNLVHLYVDGQFIKTYSHNLYTFTTPSTLNVFACNQNGTKGYLPSKMKLYTCQIYDNGTLIREYIPCYRKSDSVVGLYDIVNKTFYENQGTGEFLKGENIIDLMGHIPSVDFPQPIQNAENLSVELSGTNLFDTKAFVDNAQANGMSSTRIYEIESGIYIHQTSYQEDATKFNFGFKNGTQYTVSFDAETILQYTEGAGSCGAYFYYDDDTRNAIDIHLNSVGFKQRLTLTSTFGKNVIGFAIGVWNYRGAFNLTNVMLVENSTEQPYQPYFEPKTVQIPSEVTLASQDKLLVNYIDKSVKVNREYVKLNLADLTWNYGISSQTNVTFFNCYLPYTFTGTGYFNRGTLTNIPNAELNEMTNTIVIRTSKVGTQGQLEIAFSPDFDLKADGNNYGDVNKLMAWLEANPCEVLLKISSDLEETYTDTWASDLLALPTQNATNIITVTSSIPTSKLSVDYAEWGGKV